MKEKKPTITIYSVHSDTEQGADIEMFTTQEAEQEHCNQLIRESGDKEAIKALEADPTDSESEAWHLFMDNTEGRFNRHETEVELDDTTIIALMKQIR